MKSLKKVEGINVVPLIDVMLVLLAIILTVSSFIALGKIEIALPQASSHTKIEPKQFEILITASKQFYVNDEEVTKEELISKIDGLTKKDLVAISADKLVPYEELFLLLIY